MKKVLIFIALIALACVLVTAGCVSSESTTPSGGPAVEQTTVQTSAPNVASAGNSLDVGELFADSNIGKGKTTTYSLTQEEYDKLSPEEKAKIQVVQK